MYAPLISVTLPNYNYGRFLAESFETVLSQTYENFEILFVDDGSTDDSRTIAEHYASQDKRIKAVYFDQNRGALPAHKDTWARAQGDLVYQYSSDDALCNTGFFSLGVQALQQYPGAAGFFGVAEIISAETGVSTGYMGHADAEGYLSPKHFLDGFLVSEFFVPGISSLWKKSLIDQMGGYDYRLGPQTDYFINHALPAQAGVVFRRVLFAKARASELRKSFSSSATMEEEMKRLALFSSKMRAITGTRSSMEAEWNHWRRQRAAQLLYKYGNPMRDRKDG